jgi:disulfide bond formation protein DsbB
LALIGTGLAAYHNALIVGWVPSWWIPCGEGPLCSQQSLVVFQSIQIPWLSLLAFTAITLLLTVFLRKTRSHTPKKSPSSACSRCWQAPSYLV